MSQEKADSEKEMPVVYTRYAQMDDLKLVRLFYDGDEEAWLTIERRWQPRLFKFFRRWGLPAEDAEEKTLDALIRFYCTRETQSFDLTRPLAPYMYRLARNLAIEWLRVKEREIAKVPLDEFPVELPEPDPPLRESLMDDLEDCIGRLPEPQRTYVLLCGKHGLGELTHNEIGEVIGKWPAQVTRISRTALACLRDCLSRKGYRVE